MDSAGLADILANTHGTTSVTGVLSNGTLRRTGRGRWRLHRRRGRAEKLATVSIVEREGVTTLRIRTLPRDLSNADRGDHTVNVQLAHGNWQATHSRRWLEIRDGIAFGAAQR